MIKLTDDVNLLYSFQDSLASKVRALYFSYGLKYDFFRIYIQVNEEKETTAVIAKYYGGFTITYNDLEKVDINEINEFLNVIGCIEVQCSCDLAPFLDFPVISGVSVALPLKGTNELTSPVAAFNIIKEIYDIFINNDDSLKGLSFDDFYVDMNHRLRHGTAVIGIIDHTAYILLKEGNNYYLNGICTEKKYRHKGYGTKCLKYITDNIQGDNLYIFCKKELLSFYSII